RECWSPARSSPRVRLVCCSVASDEPVGPEILCRRAGARRRVCTRSGAGRREVSAVTEPVGEQPEPVGEQPEHGAQPAEPTPQQRAERARRADKATRGALAGILGLEAFVVLL